MGVDLWKDEVWIGIYWIGFAFLNWNYTGFSRDCLAPIVVEYWIGVGCGVIWNGLAAVVGVGCEICLTGLKIYYYMGLGGLLSTRGLEMAVFIGC
jgi:hypothetical protein